MKEETKKNFYLFLRYLFLVLIAVPGFDIFYYFLLPATLYPVYYILKISFAPVLLGHVIFLGQKSIEIVGACVAGSAYYLLLILNLSVPKIKPLLRIKMIFFSFLVFLVINIIRIIILSFMYVDNSSIFNIVHEAFWYIGSTVVVVGIWFLEVWIYKIKGVPFYTDLKRIYNESSLKRK